MNRDRTLGGESSRQTGRWWFGYGVLVFPAVLVLLVRWLVGWLPGYAMSLQTDLPGPGIFILRDRMLRSYEVVLVGVAVGLVVISFLLGALMMMGRKAGNGGWVRRRVPGWWVLILLDWVVLAGVASWPMFFD